MSTHRMAVEGLEGVLACLRWPSPRRGDSSAKVEVRGPDGVNGELQIAWQKRPQATATLEGTIGGRRLHATMPAP